MSGDEGFYDVSEIMECGVYMLLLKGLVVYVGQSRSMLLRVATHYSARAKRRPNTWQKVKAIPFDEVRVCPCVVDALDDLEQSLIAKHQPRYNTHHRTTPRVPIALASVVQQIMTHRRIASPSAAPRPQIDRRGR